MIVTTITNCQINEMEIKSHNNGKLPHPLSLTLSWHSINIIMILYSVGLNSIRFIPGIHIFYLFKKEKQESSTQVEKPQTVEVGTGDSQDGKVSLCSNNYTCILYTYTVSRGTYTDEYRACIWTSLGEFRYKRYNITNLYYLPNIKSF